MCILGDTFQPNIRSEDYEEKQTIERPWHVVKALELGYSDLSMLNMCLILDKMENLSRKVDTIWKKGNSGTEHSVQFSHVGLFVTPWIGACQASLSITNSRSSPRLTSIEWCHPAISSSVVPFSSCPQSLPASESFPMSQLFTWGL